ncbi:MAG TPA: tetratricopeptide repeat protein [Candidatus Binatia bacterium]|jgi:Flp pilus assembly protein TadD
MIRSSYLFAVVFSLLAISPARADFERSRDKPESPEYEAGRKAVEAKDYKTALQNLTKAAQKLPNDADVHNLLGYSYRKLGDTDKAFEHYRTALKLDPGHRGAHEYLGELYLETERPSEAEKELQALKKSCPWFGKCEEYDDLKAEIDKYKAKKK